MFQNAPPSPHNFLEKSVPPRGGWIVKHIRREPVSEFPPHKKVFDAWGVDYETGPFTYCSLCPPQKTGGGKSETGCFGTCFIIHPPPKRLRRMGGGL